VPRRSTLTLAERESLFAVPTDEVELIRRYAFSEQEFSVIQQHRGDHNRLGFAVQLCYMRYPGYILPPTDYPAPTLLKFAANQTGINAGEWDNYARREQTRREHLVELQTSFGFQLFTVSHYRHAVRGLDEVASQTDKGIVLAQTLVEDLRRKKVLFPSVNVIERACAEAVTRGTRRIYRILTESLTSEHRAQLDSLLEQFNGSKMTTVMWLRQSPGVPNAKHLLEHIQRLEAIQLLSLPEGAERQIHQNRLLKLAREGGQMTAQHLRDFEPTRRHATLMAVLLEARATIIDEIVDLHDRMIGVLFNRAKRAHAEQFQQSGNVTLTALAGLALRWRWWGVVFTFPLGASMVAIGFFLSYYLNALVESHRRATVLSFKGVAFNLGYGLVSLIFAFLLRALRDGGSAEQVFGRTLIWLLVWLALALVLVGVFFRRHARLLRQPGAVASDASESQP
jgi:Domain of unknown function (DUF4158)